METSWIEMWLWRDVQAVNLLVHLEPSGPESDKIFFFPAAQGQSNCWVGPWKQALFCMVTTWTLPCSLEFDKQIGICVAGTAVEQWLLITPYVPCRILPWVYYAKCVQWAKYLKFDFKLHISACCQTRPGQRSGFGEFCSRILVLT